MHYMRIKEMNRFRPVESHLPTIENENCKSFLNYDIVVANEVISPYKLLFTPYRYNLYSLRIPMSGFRHCITNV